MHGDITVEPRLGGGSIFTVVLPVEDIKLHPAGTTQIMRQTLVSAEPTQKLKLDPRLFKLNSVSPSPPPQILAASKKTEKPEYQTQHLKILVVDDSSRSLLFLYIFAD